MLVHQVERVPGELGATTGVTADQISILVTYTEASATNRKTRKKFQRYLRVIIQISSLETFVRSAAIVTVWTRKVAITLESVCESNWNALSLSRPFWV